MCDDKSIVGMIQQGTGGRALERLIRETTIEA